MIHGIIPQRLHPSCKTPAKQAHKAQYGKSSIKQTRTSVGSGELFLACVGFVCLFVACWVRFVSCIDVVAIKSE